VVTNEIASRPGPGETPAPTVGGPRSALILSRTRYPQPGFDPILNGATYIPLGDPGALRNFERMVAALDDMQIGGRLKQPDDRLQLGGGVDEPWPAGRVDGRAGVTVRIKVEGREV